MAADGIVLGIPQNAAAVGGAFTTLGCLATAWRSCGASHGYGTFATVGIIIHTTLSKVTFGGTT